MVLLASISLFACSRVPAPEVLPSDFTKINDHQFYRIAKGDGPPVVILHGLPDHSLNQFKFIETLSKTHHVLAYDRLGMGLSDKPKRSYDIQEQVEDLQEILSTHDLKRSTLLGHSVGGTIAVRYAAQNPERVSALILLNPVLLFESGHTGLRDWNTWFMKQPLIGEIMMAMHSRSVTKAVLKHMIYDDTKVTDEVVDSYYFSFQEKGTKRHFLRTLRSMYRLGTDEFMRDADKIKQSHIPVLLIWTAKDPDMPINDAPVLAERLGAQLIVIDACGHLPQIELSDDRFIQEINVPIQEFLKEMK